MTPEPETVKYLASIWEQPARCPMLWAYAEMLDRAADTGAHPVATTRRLRVLARRFRAAHPAAPETLTDSPMLRAGDPDTITDLRLLANVLREHVNPADWTDPVELDLARQARFGVTLVARLIDRETQRA